MRNKQFKLTEKAKRWVDKCGRKDLQSLKLTRTHVFVLYNLLVKTAQMKKIQISN